MPSFISNFKQRLRLPRMFFRRPTREEQIHGGPPLEFERPIPPAPWRGIAVVITIVVTAGVIALHWAMRDNTFETAVMRLPAWTITAIGAFMACAIIFTQGNSNAFIYFQF